MTTPEPINWSDFGIYGTHQLPTDWPGSVPAATSPCRSAANATANPIYREEWSR